ncbi:hypothetical protein JTB14_008708 [Gonioctena quinquepunctata]|nr:hypothetical protein JTB14_008708 [Gonioctena quinquepunctata]
MAPQPERKAWNENKGPERELPRGQGQEPTREHSNQGRQELSQGQHRIVQMVGTPLLLIPPPPQNHNPNQAEPQFHGLGMESHSEPRDPKAPDKAPPPRRRGKPGKIEKTYDPGSIEKMDRIRSDSARSLCSLRSSSVENRKRTNPRISRGSYIPRKQNIDRNSQSASDCDSDISLSTIDNVKKVQTKKTVAENQSIQTISADISKDNMADKQSNSTPEQSPPLKKHKQNDKEDDKKSERILRAKAEKQSPDVEAKLSTTNSSESWAEEVDKSGDCNPGLDHEADAAELLEKTFNYSSDSDIDDTPKVALKLLTKKPFIDCGVLSNLHVTIARDKFEDFGIGRRMGRRPLAPATNFVAWKCAICYTKQDTVITIDDIEADMISEKVFKRFKPKDVIRKTKGAIKETIATLHQVTEMGGRQSPLLLKRIFNKRILKRIHIKRTLKRTPKKTLKRSNKRTLSKMKYLMILKMFGQALVTNNIRALSHWQVLVGRTHLYRCLRYPKRMKSLENVPSPKNLEILDTSQIILDSCGIVSEPESVKQREIEKSDFVHTSQTTTDFCENALKPQSDDQRDIGNLSKNSPHFQKHLPVLHGERLPSSQESGPNLDPLSNADIGNSEKNENKHIEQNILEKFKAEHISEGERDFFDSQPLENKYDMMTYYATENQKLRQSSENPESISDWEKHFLSQKDIGKEGSKF